VRLGAELAGRRILQQPAVEIAMARADVEIGRRRAAGNAEAGVAGRIDQLALRAEDVDGFVLDPVKQGRALLVQIHVEEDHALAHVHAPKCATLFDGNTQPGAVETIGHGRFLRWATAVERVSSMSPASRPNGT
jgi:hypothetical protein